MIILRRNLSTLFVCPFILLFLVLATPRTADAEPSRITEKTSGKLLARFESEPTQDKPGSVSSSTGARPMIAGAADLTGYAEQILIEGGYALAHSALEVERELSDSRGTTWTMVQKRGGLPVLGAKVTVRTSGARLPVAQLPVGLTARVSDAPLRPGTHVREPAVRRLVLERARRRNPAGGAEIFSSTKVVIDPQVLHLSWNGEAREGWMIVTEDSTAGTRHVWLVDGASGDPLHDWEQERHILRRYIFDCSQGDGDCGLDSVFGQELYTYGRSEGQPARGGSPTLSSYNDEGDLVYERLGRLRDYYLATFGRDGADGAGGISSAGSAGDPSAGNAIAAVHTGSGFQSPFFISSCPNAYFSPARGGYFSLCTGMGVPDVLGHEYAHAVEYGTVLGPSLQPFGLLGTGESGALSEGLADIFGEMFEAYLSGANDWQIGTGSPILARSIVDPESNKHPATTFSENFYCGEGDAGGIHINSTVVSFLAKTLINGGELSGCSIAALGRAKVEQIYYRAMISYLSIGSGFADLYGALVSSCRDLYGAGSPECTAVIQGANASLINQGTRCTGDTPKRPDCDACPLDPLKAEPGACGCGAPDTDSNRDGVPNCSEKGALLGAPPAPKVFAQRNKILCIIGGVSESNPVLRVRVAYPRGHRPAKKSYELDVPTGAFTVGPLPTGSRVTVSVRYRLPAGARRFTKESRRRTVVVR